MVAGLDAVNKGLAVKKAATQFGVPWMTIQDHLRGQVEHRKNPGPKPYIVPDEEKELQQFLVNVAQAGYGKTCQQVMSIAVLFVTKEFLNQEVGCHKGGLSTI